MPIRLLSENVARLTLLFATKVFAFSGFRDRGALQEIEAFWNGWLWLLVCSLVSVDVGDIGLLAPESVSGGSVVGRVGFEPTITGARDRYLWPCTL